MPRRGQRLKVRKPAAVKPAGPAHRPVDPLAAHPLMRYVTAHLEWMVIHGYSQDTARARRIALRRFVAWCEGCGLDDPRTVTLAVLERYQRHLFLYRKPDGSPLTVGSQFGCLAPLRTWFAWLTREHHIAFNPASELQLPKLPKRLPRGLLSPEDIAAILHEADPGTAQGLRDRALLETLCATGLRRMELAALARYDIDLNRQLVFVRAGKGAKDRVVPLGERAAAWVDRYLIEARPQLIAGEPDALFVTDYGEPISPAWLADKVKRHMQFAGIERNSACGDASGRQIDPFIHPRRGGLECFQQHL